MRKNIKLGIKTNSLLMKIFRVLSNEIVKGRMKRKGLKMHRKENAHFQRCKRMSKQIVK